ncbi:hypothetical protein glysoja_024279, partial [Glycine soja]
INNLVAVAIMHVLHNKRDFLSVNSVEDLLVLSIENEAQAKRMNNTGECSTSTVVDIALEGVFETVDQMLENAFCWNHTIMRRFATSFTDGKSRLLLRTCVTEAVVELFITKLPSTAAHEIFSVDGGEVEGSEGTRGRRQCEVRSWQQ